MTKKEFDELVAIDGRCDRIIDDWRILDIHRIPKTLKEYHEIDFYCNKLKKVILLRIRNRAKIKYDILKDPTLEYWVAEFPIKKLDNQVLANVLKVFETLI